MTINWMCVAALVAVALGFSAMPAVAEDGDEAVQSTAKLETEADRVSYAIGAQVGKSLKQVPVELNMKVFFAALEDALAERTLALSEADMRSTMMALQQAAMEKQKAEQAEQAGKNTEEGVAYLAANKEKDGVLVTDSGLQYKVVEAGSGASPAATDKVKVNYRGTLIDGTEFDSSYSRGEPATFGVNQVIPGWTEGLQLMKPGAKYEFCIPSELAYGANPRPGGKIGPNAVLVFEVELLEIL